MSSLDNTLGALFLGVVLAALLHVSIVQAWYYYTHQNDKWPLKSLVAAVMVCDTVHQALITQTVYFYVISSWGNPKQLGNLVWGLLLEVLFNAITALLVQSFLTVRLWRLSNRNIFLTTITALFVLAEFVSSFVYTVWALHLETFAQLGALKSLSLAVNAFTVAGDVFIAGALCSLLHLSRTGFQRSDTMINKLMLFSVNTGLLTSLFAVASFISYMAAPNTFIYIAFYFCIGRLYTNALLATLNGRRMISDSADTHTNTNDVSLSFLSKHRPTSRQRGRGGANISIKINTTKEFVTDLMPDQEEEHHEDKVATSNSSAYTGSEEKKNDVV